MVDNVTSSAGTADGPVFATDDISSVHFPRMKIAWGTDGAAVDASASNPFPVVQTGAMVPGTAASNLGKAEDSAHASADVGVLMLAVRRDTAAVGSSDDGDNSTLNVNSAGRLYTSATVDAALPAGTNNIGDVDVLSIAAGDNNIGNVDIASIAAGDNNIGNVDVVTLPALPAGNNNIGDVDAIQSGTWNIGTVTTVTTVATVSAVTAVGTITPGTAATSLGKAEDTAHASADVGVLALAVRRDTAAVGSDTDGDNSTLNVDAGGRLWVNAGQIVDDAAFTPATSRVLPIAFQADETATDSVDEGDAGTPRMTLDRKVITTSYAHAAAGGASPFYNLDVDETEDAIKASAGKLMALHVMNLANAKRYVKFYNATTANVTVGSTAPVLSFPVPTMGDTNGAGFTFPIPDCGIQFDTAITIAATTGFADNDTGAPGTNEVIVNGAYI